MQSPTPALCICIFFSVDSYTFPHSIRTHFTVGVRFPPAGMLHKYKKNCMKFGKIDQSGAMFIFCASAQISMKSRASRAVLCPDSCSAAAPAMLSYHRKSEGTRQFS